MMKTPIPLGLLAELSHRCPLSCPYCSNPVELIRKSGELNTEDWRQVFEQAAEMGVLHVHLSGGEPTVRRDLEELVSYAAEVDLYTNLITSGVLLDETRVQKLADAGLDHIQLSIQAASADLADQIGGFSGGHLKKLAVAGWVKAAGLPLTINAVVHRRNLHELGALIDVAIAAGAGRVEIAHTQYQGWALRNREELMPTREQLDEATALIEMRRKELKGILTIDYVVPDYHGVRPKACMGGWGQKFLVIAPDGRVLPCHAADSIPELEFANIRDETLDEIWRGSSAFNRFRGTDWMPEPCRSCPEKEKDWGGCRCQALALTGNAGNADPVCELSPEHHIVEDYAAVSADADDDAQWDYRGY